MAAGVVSAVAANEVYGKGRAALPPTHLNGRISLVEGFRSLEDCFLMLENCSAAFWELADIVVPNHRGLKPLLRAGALLHWE